MPRTKISEFSATPGSNTDIDGIDIAEGCAPSGINNAIREMMAQLKDFQAGTAGDAFNGAVNGAVNGSVGATTADTGAFTNFTASGTASFTSTGAVRVSSGTTGQRPTPATAMFRFNTSTVKFEGYNGTVWGSIGGGATIANDTVTATNLFPAFLNATSGEAADLFTSNAKLLYKPSTGELQSTVLVAGNGIVVNSSIIAENYTIGTNYNAMSAGTITINSGVVVTVSSGSTWVVV